MNWIDNLVPGYGTVTGQYVAISYDSSDADLTPDVQPLNGTITLTPTVTAGRIDTALAQILAVTVRVFGGQIVDDEDQPGVRIMSNDTDLGVQDWAWTARFDFESGLKLRPLPFKVGTGETVNLTSGIVPVESVPYQIVQGETGGRGESAYQVAVRNGYTGTETQWLDALRATTIEQVTGLRTALDDRPRMIDSFRWLGQMAAGADVDQMLTRGFQEWTKPNAAGHNGLPPGVTEQGTLETIHGLSTWTTLQRATEALTGRMWLRLIRNPGTFQWWPWRELAFTDMLTASVGGTTRLAADWLHVGDSLTDDVALGAGQWTRVLAGLTGRAHETRGWYNQRTFEIAARMGATLYPVTVTGGSIPSTAAVSVTGQRAQQLAFGGYAGLMSRKIPGWLAGRHGTLQNPDNGTSMVFTPDDGKPATTVTGTAWFEGDMTPHLGRVVTIWAGTNDRTTSTPTELLELVRGMISRVPHGRVYVFGLMPDPNGAANTQITAINRAYRTEWPDLYFDPGVALMTAQAATDAGITYTAQDQADIAAGHVPGSFRSDSIHLNANGAKALAYAVFRDAIARGWALPSGGVTGARQTLPALPAAPVTVSDVTGLSARLGGLEYDSGWRNVSTLLEPGIGGSVFISRKGNEVHMMFHNITTTTEGNRDIYLLPTGFQPTTISGANWRNGTLATDNGDTVRQTSFFNNRMRVLSMPTGKQLGGYIVFRVPTTLPPGTPPGAAA